MTDSPLLLSPARAAKELGVGRDRVYALVRAGEIEHLSVGRKVLIPTWALEAWTRRAAEGSLGNGRAATTKEGD